MFFIQQTNKYDCGFTCLKILLANIHHDGNYLFLKSHYDLETSFLDVIKEGEKYGTTLLAVKATDKKEIRNNTNIPCIARIAINNVSHAVYIYKMSKKYIYYFDPTKGKEKLLIDDFISIWTSELIIIKDFKKTKCPITKPKYMKNSEIIITLFMQFISALTSAVSIYFISKDSYIYLPVIFFTTSLITSIILKKYSVLLLKRIDKRIEEKIKDIKDQNYYDFYVTYEEYKKYLLLNNMNVFMSLILFILISFIFIINDKTNIIYVLVNILLAGTYALFIKPKLNQDIYEIKENEELIKDKKDKLEAFSYMNMAREKAYKYIDKENAYKYIVIALEVTLSFILMMYHELVSVSYIICYTFLEITLYGQVINLLTSNDNFNKQDNLLNKLIDNIENK